MTQVQTMTNAELNRALADLMGYRVQARPPGDNGRIWFELVRPGGKVDLASPTIDLAFAYGPDYCTDPAASLEVQTAACKHNFTWYVNALSDIAASDAYWEDGRMDHEGISKMLTARPRERAEAAYITLQGERK